LILKFISTRGSTPATFDEALIRGLAPDGGLYLPESLPQTDLHSLAPNHDICVTARNFLSPYIEGSSLEGCIDAIISESFSFSLPVTTLPVLHGSCGLLELYHGPTAAFKDVGAGFLAACLSRLEGDTQNPLTILVATSGDTGGAVAAAFNGRSGIRVVVLYPHGKVSDRQAHQLTCWGDNVLSLAVNGSFDDCQALVKGAMADEALSTAHRFSSANSINIGRLLPQAIYYAHASAMHQARSGRYPGFIIPTGNLGNAFACFLAREAGSPIGDIILSTNANCAINDYLDGAAWEPRASIRTLASAMDVGNPSNMERLRHLGGEADQLKQRVRAVSVSDAQITQQIRLNFDEFGIATCPHTATATCAWRNLDSADKLNQDWILVATAHPAKFEQIVEPIIGANLPLPDELANMLSRPRRFVEIDASMADFEDALGRGFAP
jgi:threonine synthase